MNNTRDLIGRIKFIFCAALFGALTAGSYAQPGPSVSVALPSVEIRAESDFYEPLTPHGEWVVIGSYGRCWRPARVEAGWRPYCNGNWQRTDAGWYWVSEEPWAWATYHYGRWDFNDEYGWYWVPQTQWAPAWVSWHRGGGYVGWAPLYPSARIASGVLVEVDVKIISPRAYVFVQERSFLEPIRPKTVIVNNTTIINKTVNITNVKVVNNTVINEGPQTQVIEQASGRKVQAVPVRELRRKTEAQVAARQAVAPAAAEKKEKAVQPPLPPTGPVKESEKTKSISSQPEPRPETPRPAEVKEPTAPTVAKPAEPSEKSAGTVEKKAPGKPERRDKEKPAPGEKSKSDDKEHESKPKN